MKGAKNVGIPGVTIPSKTCDDDNCPFHGTLRVRGIILEGTIVKFRANKTAVFER